jgi:hypothetical protein
MASLENNGRRISEQFETTVSDLWNKIRVVAGVVHSLHEKNSALAQKNYELEGMIAALEEKISTLEKKNSDIEEKLPMKVDVGERLLYLTSGEREAMERQIEELLAILKPHVG